MIKNDLQILAIICVYIETFLFLIYTDFSASLNCNAHSKFYALSLNKFAKKLIRLVVN